MYAPKTVLCLFEGGGNREQTALVLVLVLYVICFIVTMMSAWEKPHSTSG
jgi:hypothetical protein